MVINEPLGVEVFGGASASKSSKSYKRTLGGLKSEAYPPSGRGKSVINEPLRG